MLVNARKLWTVESDSLLVLMAIEDVTERNRIHEELVRSNEDLQRFAYVAAHDLRSPLNSALSLFRLLTRRTEEKLDEQERDMLRASIANLERLNELIEDILTFWKWETLRSSQMARAKRHCPQSIDAVSRCRDHMHQVRHSAVL
jgi:light-regulated signal transduction histidine kinase (bacteriophytochrome)